MTLQPSFPTHSEVAAYIQRYLPAPVVNARSDVPFLWHTPRNPAYNALRQKATRAVLSVTPTPGYYQAISDPTIQPPAIGFLHRPWNLNRRGLRSGSSVFASHIRFDEHLTVGWNIALGQRLGCVLDEGGAVCIKGYKGDPERKIGLVAKLSEPVALSTMTETIRKEFDGAGELHNAVDESRDVRILAIMNAFHAEEIERVMLAAEERGWIGELEDVKSILYLTGAARDYGLEAIRTVGIPAVCVGHRACEEWGVRFLAEELRRAWPTLDVVVVLEEEEPVPKVEKKKRVNGKSAEAEALQT